MTKVQELYEPRVREARETIQTHPTMRELLSDDLSPQLLTRFLIQFSAWGVNMTKPVSSWLNRSADRCDQLEMTEIGRVLRMHAKHEADHDLMMVEDTKSLVKVWNENNDQKLDVDQLLNQPITKNMNEYIRIHEEIVDSKKPFEQVAIALEIEGLSASFGVAFVEHCQKMLDADARKGLSFIEEHAELDVGHVALLTKLMETVLGERPGEAESLAKVGVYSIQIYIGFLTDCLNEAKNALQVAA